MLVHAVDFEAYSFAVYVESLKFRTKRMQLFAEPAALTYLCLLTHMKKCIYINKV